MLIIHLWDRPLRGSKVGEKSYAFDLDRFSVYAPGATAVAITDEGRSDWNKLVRHKGQPHKGIIGVICFGVCWECLVKMLTLCKNDMCLLFYVRCF